MRASRRTLTGSVVPRLQMQVYNLENEDELNEFLKDELESTTIPGSDTVVHYREKKKTGVWVSRLGTSRAVSLGAYHYAVNRLQGIN